MAKGDRIWTNARLATLDPARSGLGIVDNGAIAVRDGRILFAGSAADLPSTELSGAGTIDCDGRWITPGLIDPHTHLVFGGDRAHEFELRLTGASYEEIARAGGGIVSTMKATRTASEEELLAAALPRLDALIAEGASETDPDARAEVLTELCASADEYAEMVPLVHRPSIIGFDTAAVSPTIQSNEGYGNILRNIADYRIAGE